MEQAVAEKMTGNLVENTFYIRWEAFPGKSHINEIVMFTTEKKTNHLA